MERQRRASKRYLRELEMTRRYLQDDLKAGIEHVPDPSGARMKVFDIPAHVEVPLTDEHRENRHKMLAHYGAEIARVRHELGLPPEGEAA